MHTITEARRDLSSQIDNFPPNLLNNTNGLAQNRGGGDGVTTVNTGQTMISFAGQQPINNMPSCRNNTSNNYFHAERNDAVRQLWRQHTHSCINQRSNGTIGGNQQLPLSIVSPQQQHGVVNHLGRLEQQSQQLYNNLTENSAAAAYRQSQLLNNTMHIEQNRRNYLAATGAADPHNFIQPPTAMDQTAVFLNYTSNNISQHYPSPIGGGNTNTPITPYVTLPQYNYQNVSTPITHNHNNNTTQIPPNLNYPIHPTLPSPQLVFGPPPRDRRPNLNNLIDDSNRPTTFPEVYTSPTQSSYYHDSNQQNTSPSIPINSIFQSFSNHLKIPDQVIPAQDPRHVKSNFNRNLLIPTHQCTSDLNDCNAQKSYYVIPATVNTNGSEPSNLPDVSNTACISDPTDGTNQIYTARSNMKLKFSKNVVNIPKKIDNCQEKVKNELEASKESMTTCTTSDIYMSANSKTTSQQYSEDVFNCQIRDTYNNKIDDTYNFPSSLILEEDRQTSPFVLHEESAFIDMIVEGCIHGEEIATKYQNVPCFKNIKKLCEKTKTDLMTPHCTARNIHSQGIPWATKDYIFAFTRLTSCWYLLKGYLGHKSDVFDKIEQLYSPELRKSFELWEQTTINLAFHVMKSFIALGNNSTVKWNPNAHSTPVTPKDIRKKIVSTIPASIISIDLDETQSKQKAELQILARNNLDSSYTSKANEKYYRNGMKDFQNHIFKPILQVNNTARYDFDSGDEDSSKKYIKPGCYSVPQIRNPNSPTISPRPFSDLEELSIKSKKMTPVIILSHHHRNDQNLNHIYTSQQPTHSQPEYIPFKKTPQGIITSALMKKSREDFPKPPDLHENSTDTKLFDTLKNSSLMEDLENSNLYSKKYNSNDVINCKVTVERCVEVDESEENNNKIVDCKEEENQRNVSGYISKSTTNKMYGTKKQYRSSIETKSSIRKGIFVTTKRRSSSEHSAEYQTKSSSASIKKAHKSYYNTILSSPKYLDENSNIRLRQKCRQNFKWNIWYSRKRDGLSHLAIDTFQRILNELWNMPSSHYFVFEVDVRDVPDYYEIIKHPMFLTNILQKLKQYKYNNLNQVVHDFRRIFRNARIFLEVHPDKRLQRLITHFSNAFEQLLNDSFPRIDFSTIMGEENEILSGTNFDPKKKSSSSPRSSSPSKSDENNTSPSSQEDR